MEVWKPLVGFKINGANVRGLNADLAKKYNTTKGNIKTIVAGKSWKHIL